MSATPRPWGRAKMGGGNSIFAGKALDNRRGLLRIEKGGISEVAVCPDDEVSAAVAKSNAALICRAVNAHDALAAVAKDWLNVLDSDGAECTCAPGDICPRCRCMAALKLAGAGR